MKPNDLRERLKRGQTAADLWEDALEAVAERDEIIRNLVKRDPYSPTTGRCEHCDSGRSDPHAWTCAWLIGTGLVL